MQADLSAYEFFGELALSGAIRSIVGEIPLALACKMAGNIAVFPLQNAVQAQQVPDLQLCGAEHLLQLHAFLVHHQALPAIPVIPDSKAELYPDLAEVRGQAQAKRVLEIAAAGEHNLLMFGPAGTGKSMLAQRLPGILPTLSDQEALETAAIYSVAAQPRTVQQWHQRPFRQPHHTCSAVALVGGGCELH